MGLADELKAVPKPAPLVRCRVYYLRETIEGEDLHVFNDTIAKLVAIPGNERKNGKSGLTARWLSDVLKANGHDISSSTIQRHISGKCTCGVI